MKNTKTFVRAVELSVLLVFLFSGIIAVHAYWHGFHDILGQHFLSLTYVVFLLLALVGLVVVSETQMPNKRWVSLVLWGPLFAAGMKYFHSLTPFLVACTLMGSVFLLGRDINRRISKKYGLETNHFLDFCLGHVVVAFGAWLIVRFTQFYALHLLQAFFVLLLVHAAVCLNRPDGRAFLVALRKPMALDWKERTLLYAVGVAYAVSALLYMFVWDDLNAYLYAPLRIYMDHGFHFGPDRPAFLTNVSEFSFGFGGLIASVLGWDRTKFLFGFKLFHAMSYFVGVATFVYSFPFFKKQPVLRWLWLLLVALVPIVEVEIVGNFLDFYVYLCVMLIGYRMAITALDSEEGEDHVTKLYEAGILGLFAIASLKCIPYIVAYFFGKALLSVARRGVVRSLRFPFQDWWLKGLQVLALAAPLSVLLIHNLILAGDPTFPASNNFWKTPYFFTNGIVVLGTHFSSVVDGTVFFNLFSLFPKALDVFPYNYYGLYGVALQVLLLLLPFLAMLVAVKVSAGCLTHGGEAVDIAPSLFFAGMSMMVAIMSFFFVTHLVGPQERYFIGLPAFIVLAFLGLLKPLLDADEGKRVAGKRIVAAMLLVGLAGALCVFLGTSPNAPPYKVTQDHILIPEGQQGWLKKKDFYAQANEMLKGYAGNILIFYVQDKFFLDSPHVYEFDWYDFPIQHKIESAWLNQGPAVETRVAAVRDVLCAEGFGYFILSTNRTLFDQRFTDLYLKRTSLFNNEEALYAIDCGQERAPK